MGRQGPPTNAVITIDNLAIHQDQAGRFNLNDLHKAAGGEPKHRPNYWLTNDTTVSLIAEVEKAGIPAINSTRGRSGGTFVVKELVYAYAMWISPQFSLKVIRAYDRLATEGAPNSSPHPPHLRWPCVRLP